MNDECLYFVNYLGQFENSEIQKQKDAYKNIFVDNTQSFFQRPVRGVDTAYSCRKYFGLSDGAYLYTELSLENEYERLPVDISHEKMLYVMGRFETTGSQYYDLFIENEKIERGQPAKKMSLLIQNILKGIDYLRIQERRRQNFNYLANNLTDINKLNIKNTAGFFYYPLYIKNGNLIRKNLIEHKIYVPILWPNVLTDKYNEDGLEYDFANNIIFLPIDQRYDTENMNYIVKILNSITNKD
jgi:hypothetical protein